ncbi:hypothetical protein [Bacillus sp. UNCCL81]|uniref:hypothetical protein n=1 Tax=Bacillus sp. UNCCL81 TaxID=1502755 RepID=UPI0008EF7ECF|nr:hypothetical protein [Bacillus sp. UNCCL81]SFC52092.1 hypothetical protein SAMN02799633_01077 [Bacillus sp. UNCCL81]
MITASNLFNGNMMANSRIVDSYIVMNGTTTYDSSKIVTWEFHDTVSLSDVFEIGTAISNVFNVVLQNITPTFAVDKTTIEPFVGVNVGGATYEYVSLGKFIVDDIQYESVVKRYTLSCSDYMTNLDIDYTWTAGATDTIANVMSRISTLSGVPLSGTYPTTTINKQTGFTCREMLGFMAGLMAGWGVINRSGQIAVKVPKNTDPNINPIWVTASAITFDTNISNYVLGQYYTWTVNSASRTLWDSSGVKVGDYLYQTGTITQINGYTITFRCDNNFSDNSSPSTMQLNVQRFVTSDLTVMDDNYFDYVSGSTDLYILEQITGIDYNGNTYTSGTKVKNMELRIKNPFITQSYVNSIAATINGRVFYAFVMDWQGNPALEAGDNIRFEVISKMPWAAVVTDTVWQYPDFSAVSQTLTESRLVNSTPDDDTGDVVNGADIVNSNIYGGLLIKSNSGGTTAGSFNSGLYGIHMNNQDIRGCNTIVFNDELDASLEGILFPKTGALADSVTSSDYFILKVDGSGSLKLNADNIFQLNPTFTNLTLQNGATVNNSRTPKYTKLNGIVYLEGEISAGLANGTVVATLPVGYRPASYSLNIAGAHATSAATNPCVWSVGTSGQIILISSNGTNAVSLNNIQFVAEQ